MGMILPDNSLKNMAVNCYITHCVSPDSWGRRIPIFDRSKAVRFREDLDRANPRDG